MSGKAKDLQSDRNVINSNENRYLGSNLVLYGDTIEERDLFVCLVGWFLNVLVNY